MDKRIAYKITDVHIPSMVMKHPLQNCNTVVIHCAEASFVWNKTETMELINALYCKNPTALMVWISACIGYWICISDSLSNQNYSKLKRDTNIKRYFYFWQGSLMRVQYPKCAYGPYRFIQSDLKRCIHLSRCLYLNFYKDVNPILNRILSTI